MQSVQLSARAPLLSATWPLWLTAAVCIGGFHELEHIIQVVQRYMLGIPDGNGILGSVVDIEPLHFAYNIAYLLLLSGLVAALSRERVAAQTIAAGLVSSALVFQYWHVIEHVAKMLEYVQLGFTNGTGGIFGAGPGGLVPLVPIPLLHFAYNTIVYVPVLAAAVLIVRTRLR